MWSYRVLHEIAFHRLESLWTRNFWSGKLWSSKLCWTKYGCQKTVLDTSVAEGFLKLKWIPNRLFVLDLEAVQKLSGKMFFIGVHVSFKRRAVHPRVTTAFLATKSLPRYTCISVSTFRLRFSSPLLDTVGDVTLFPKLKFFVMKEKIGFLARSFSWAGNGLWAWSRLFFWFLWSNNCPNFA